MHACAKEAKLATLIDGIHAVDVPRVTVSLPRATSSCTRAPEYSFLIRISFCLLSLFISFLLFPATVFPLCQLPCVAFANGTD